jgi:hypothetical protein
MEVEVVYGDAEEIYDPLWDDCQHVDLGKEEEGSVTRPVATAAAAPALVRTSSSAPMMELDDKTALLDNDTSQEAKSLCSIELKERKLQDRHAHSTVAIYPGLQVC